MHQMPRLTTAVSQDTFEKLKELSERERRSLSLTIDLLLQWAIKEKTRKRNASKESNS
jgi:hypothetical protein